MGVDPKKSLEPRGREKKIFRPSRGSGLVALENFEKIVFRIG